MSGSTAVFHCLEVLEKEFDKAFVDLDVLIGETDYDEDDITLEAREKMSTLSSCFSQLCHKTQTTAQSNAKLEVLNLFVYFLFFSLICGINHGCSFYP